MQTLHDFAPSAKLVVGDKLTLMVADFSNLIRQQISAIIVDEKFYRARYPDVAKEIAEGKIKSGRDHFLKWGFAEGRFPAPPLNFDEAWYLGKYPDIAEAVRSDALKSGLDHYIEAGCREGRLPTRSAK